MSFRGYDHWKTTEPDPNADCICEQCGGPLCNDGNCFLYCERCEEAARADYADRLYDEWRDRQMDEECE